MLYRMILCCIVCFLPSISHADSHADSLAKAAQVYHQSLVLAAQGKTQQAVVALQAASRVLAKQDVWQARMQAAAALLQMQKTQSKAIPKTERNDYLAMASAYVRGHQKPEATAIWPAAVLATLLPGAGHAWLGRWHDTLMAACFVWPFLCLTFWAGKRKMGPVTVFFALLTVWLWSGTVFSAISLAERGSFELYLQWWQGVWQAAALPGRAW